MQLKTAWLLLCASTASLSALAAPAGDVWSGHYRMTWVKGPAANDKTPDEVFWIVRAPDADPTKPSRIDGRTPLPEGRAPDADPVRLAEKLGLDLMRWVVSFDGKIDQEKSRELRRFSPAEYEDLGWTSMHAAGRIHCLNGGYNLFLCRVKPGTTVTVGRAGPSQEKLLARTGIFGAALHAGAFELTKIGAGSP